MNLSEFDNKNDNHNSNDDNNNNELNNSSKNKRGPYRKLERLRILHEIESLLIEGYDEAYIMQKFNMSQATFYRYRKEAYKEEKRVLVGLSLDTLLEKIVLFEKRLSVLALIARNIALDRNVSGADRVNAIHVLGEIERARLHAYTQGPTYVSQSVRAYPQSGIEAHEALRKELELMKDAAMRQTLQQRGRERQQLPTFQSETTALSAGV